MVRLRAWHAPRLLVLAAVTLLLAAGVTAVSGATSDTAHAATIAINQCNGNETGAAQEIRCDVTVTNNIDITTGVTSSVVSTTVCTGVPGDTVCVSNPDVSSSDIVGSVDQCNNSANAGGSILECNVSIVNNITGVGDTSPATVNQCIGSGQGGGADAPDLDATECSPRSATSGADVTQCNTAGNNGGAINRVNCTVNTSTVSSLWPTTIVQCNDSANGGGDLVTCTAQITTSVIAPVETTTTTTVPAATTTVAPDTTTTAAPADTVPTTVPPTVPANTFPPELPQTGSTSPGLVLLAAAVTLAGLAVVRGARRPELS